MSLTDDHRAHRDAADNNDNDPTLRIVWALLAVDDTLQMILREIP